MTKIGIIGAGTGALPSEVLRMAEEANVEIVELDKDFSPTEHSSIRRQSVHYSATT